MASGRPGSSRTLPVKSGGASVVSIMTLDNPCRFDIARDFHYNSEGKIEGADRREMSLKNPE